MHLLLERFSDGEDLGFASAVCCILIRPQFAEGGYSVFGAVFGQKPTRRTRDEDGEERDDCE